MLSIYTSVGLSRNSTDMAQTLLRVFFFFFFFSVRFPPVNANFKVKQVGSINAPSGRDQTRVFSVTPILLHYKTTLFHFWTTIVLHWVSQV